MTPEDTPKTEAQKQSDKIAARDHRLNIAVSDMHSRVTTLYTWGMSHDVATSLMKEAFEIFLEENSTREMERKKTKPTGASFRREMSGQSEEDTEEPQPEDGAG